MMEKDQVKKVEKEALAALIIELDSSIKETIAHGASMRSSYRLPDEDLTFSNFFSDRMLMVQAIKEGITYHMFSLIQKLSPFTNTEWSDMLNLSAKSMNRYRVADKRFKSLQSEKIIELAEVTKVGLEVFDSSGQFKLWLETPNFALGMQKPKDLLYDSYGKDLVIGELTRIDEGIFA
jgi:putative toxin-antitoxin system antitoxin component (TIGR02293 family)